MAFRSITADTSGFQVTSVAVARPSGAVAGDILVAFVRQNEDNATCTAPAGWTQQANGTVGSSPISRLSVWTADGAVSSLTFTFNATTDVTIHIACYSGVSAVEAAALGQTTDTASGTAVTAPSLTATTAATTLVCGFSARQGNGPTSTPPGTMVERSDVSFPSILSVCDEAVTGTGATGTRVSTLSAGQLNRLAASVLLTTTPADVAGVPSTISQYMGYF